MRTTLTCPQLDISEDGFLNLMSEDGTTKDDVKMPEGEVGEKIERLFKIEEKDTSMLSPFLVPIHTADRVQMSSS